MEEVTIAVGLLYRTVTTHEHSLGSPSANVPAGNSIQKVAQNALVSTPKKAVLPAYGTISLLS